MTAKKQFICIITLIIFIISLPVFADFKDDALVLKISGGEFHTLVLTQNNCPWGCGDNYFRQLGIGNDTSDQKLLVRVHGVDDVGFLEDINDIAAGWKHSLALDVNGFSLASVAEIFLELSSYF